MLTEVLLSVIACELGVLIYILARDPKTIVIETDPGVKAEVPKQQFKSSVPFNKKSKEQPMPPIEQKDKSIQY